MPPVASEPIAGALPHELREALLRVIQAGKLELPMLPEVAGKVITASMDERCDLKQLTSLINRDQSMAAHVLRIANSALYSPTSPIVSLQQALTRLGTKKVREVAIMISCEAKVFRVEGFDLAVRALFKHSTAAAVWAQEIARMRRWNVEEAFLCGLLHDVGKPVVLQAVVDLRNKMNIECDRTAIENSTGEFHCGAGADLAKSWKLPARLSETIRYHHDPESSPTAGQTAMMTNFADDLAHWLVGPRKVTDEDLKAHDMIGPLNVYPEEMEQLFAMKDKVQGMVDSVS